MTSRMKQKGVISALLMTALSVGFIFTVHVFSSLPAQAADSQEVEFQNQNRFIQIQAQNKQDRSAIANLGVSIEAVRSDSVWGFANPHSIERLKKGGFT